MTDYVNKHYCKINIDPYIYHSDQRLDCNSVADHNVWYIISVNMKLLCCAFENTGWI